MLKKKIIINSTLILINIFLNFKYNLKFTCLNSLNLTLYLLCLFLICVIFVICIEKKTKKIFKECMITFSIVTNFFFLIFLLYVYHVNTFDLNFFPLLVEKVLSTNELINQLVQNYEITHSTTFRCEEKEMFQILLREKTYKEGLFLLNEFYFFKKVTYLKVDLKNISIDHSNENWNDLLRYFLEITGEKILGRPFSIQDLVLMSFGCLAIFSVVKFLIQAPFSDFQIAYRRDPRDFERVVCEDFISNLKRPNIEQHTIYRQLKWLANTPPDEKWSGALTEILTPPITRDTDNLINLYDLNLRLNHSLYPMESERLLGNTFSRIETISFAEGLNFKEEFHNFHLLTLKFYEQLLEELVIAGRKDIIPIEEIGRLNVLNQVFLSLLELNAILYDLSRTQEIDMHNFEIYARIFFYRENKIIYEGKLFDQIRKELQNTFEEIQLNSSRRVTLSDYDWSNSLENLIAKYMRIRPRYSQLLSERQQLLEQQHLHADLIEKLYEFFG